MKNIFTTLLLLCSFSVSNAELTNTEVKANLSLIEIAETEIKEIDFVNETFDFISKYEGFSNTPYLCPANKLTIGYGFLYKSYYRNYLTKQQADKILKNKIRFIDLQIRLLLDVDLSYNQRIVLTSFCYNVGFYGFKKSTLLKLINKKENNLVIKKELLKWVNVKNNLGKKKRLRGLELRRLKEANLWSQP